VRRRVRRSAAEWIESDGCRSDEPNLTGARLLATTPDNDLYGQGLRRECDTHWPSKSFVDTLFAQEVKIPSLTYVVHQIASLNISPHSTEQCSLSQFYSCFISCNSPAKMDFARRLRSQMRDNHRLSLDLRR